MSANETIDQHTFHLYQSGKVIKQIVNFKPLVAQWEKNTHPAQICLHNYLALLQRELTPEIEHQKSLFLHLEIDVVEEKNLLNQHDVENYLTPLFSSRCLDARQFVLVSGRKKVGGGSCLTVGKAVPLTENAPAEGWRYFSCSPGDGADNKAWKERIRSAMEASSPEVVVNEPVEVRLAWRIGHCRNWVNLWKPTGDAMGPVLGYVQPGNLFHPHDDRIIHLCMHKTFDGSLGNDVDVGMWWRTQMSKLAYRRSE